MGRGGGEGRVPSLMTAAVESKVSNSYLFSFFFDVWGYVLGMFLVQDTSKYFFYQTLLAYGFEGIKTSADLQALRAQELLGESVEAKVDVLEVVVKELAAKADAVEGLAAQVAALQLEVASLKNKWHSGGGAAASATQKPIAQKSLSGDTAQPSSSARDKKTATVAAAGQKTGRPCQK